MNERTGRLRMARNGSALSSDRERPGSGINPERWGWYSIGVNGFLLLLHGTIAATSGSLAAAAELVHNIVDLLTAVAVLAGLKLAMRKSRHFPYGLYKVENLVAAGLAAMILFAAYEIARDALLAPPVRVRVEYWMIAALIVTTAVPVVFSHFELTAGQAANSPSLVADAREYRLHLFTTSLVLLSLLSADLEFPLDRVAASIIVVAVTKTGWDLLRDAMRVLLDASIDAETLGRVREMIDGDPAVIGLTWITGRNAGRFRFIEAGAALRVADLDQAEAVIRRIEANIRVAVPHVERVLIHVEAPASPTSRFAVPLADRAGTVSVHFGEAPYFAIVTLYRDRSDVEEISIFSNPHCMAEKSKGIRVAEWLVAKKIDEVMMKEDLHGKGPEYVLRDAGVSMRQADFDTLADLISSL